ncbi:DUF1203 domain-containing protein [Rhizobium sp. L1K21]|uniref:DUF1203 domain-containing protein n=1 Tax=Rhizobium sp. L1K21 TaxID=2954933 RepID=UPI002093257E|nr:DUF1203 domain-containing protein [Rhizobium sp. L1K21]MCO6185872.1 DUF1203 domain-containing protein [Rhizobium sp. L1K21]
MSKIRYEAMSSEDASRYRSGGNDAYGMKPERRISDGTGLPCRHCLDFIAEGEPYLILAHRPFPAPQPYAETGPIFIHAEECPRYAKKYEQPPVLKSNPDYILRGYGLDDRIVYGTGAVTPVEKMEARAEELLARSDIAYVHVRSARNNCFQARIDRG